jgi:hypothetical protein
MGRKNKNYDAAGPSKPIILATERNFFIDIYVSLNGQMNSLMKSQGFYLDIPLMISLHLSLLS